MHTVHRGAARAALATLALGLATVAPVSALASADAPLNASAGTYTVTQGQTINGPIGSFIDADPAGFTAQFSATINWGDGTAPTAATIVEASSDSGNQWNIDGTHTYTQPGHYTAAIIVRDVGGASTRTSADYTVKSGFCLFGTTCL